MKTAVREEFKTRFDGSDKPLENMREAVGLDGRLDEEVNHTLLFPRILAAWLTSCKSTV